MHRVINIRATRAYLIPFSSPKRNGLHRGKLKDLYEPVYGSDHRGCNGLDNARACNVPVEQNGPVNVPINEL